MAAEQVTFIACPVTYHLIVWASEEMLVIKNHKWCFAQLNNQIDLTHLQNGKEINMTNKTGSTCVPVESVWIFIMLLSFIAEKKDRC